MESYEHEHWQAPMLASIRSTYAATHGLTLLHDVLAEQAGTTFLALLETLSAPEPAPLAIATAYSRTFRELAAAAQDESTLQLPRLSDTWQAYLVARLLDASSLWSTLVERSGPASVPDTLRAQARRDLRTLQRLFRLSAETILELVQKLVTPALPALDDAWTSWRELAPTGIDGTPPVHAREILAQEIAACDNWETLLPALEKYWTRHGTGPLAHYRILRWEENQQSLIGIAHPDPIQLTSLIGQQRQQGRLRANVERLLAGLPAHDMLLYGPPGTGKSSTIKALVNTYEEQGLRLVEIRRDDIGALPQIVAQLRTRAPRYLIFIDDLSFEEHETAYKVLKVMLEGTAEARPRNMLICATSNRINLIRENFAERGKPGEDVNWRDTMDEKQSLAHRFGLRVTFFSPDQQQYLTIVDELVRQRDLELSVDDLHTRALSWERQHTGRSGRVARQFVDDLEAELKYVRQEQFMRN
jgi:predicted AAA+ superfamily ATPase